MGGNCAPDEELIEDFNKHDAGWIYWMWWNYSKGIDHMVVTSNSLIFTKQGRNIANYLEGAKEATIFPDDPLPDDIPGIPEPVEGWDPGPVTTSQQFSTGRWLQVELEKSIEMASYVEMEVQGGETMNYAGWGNAFAVGVEDALYIGKRVRFWVYAGNGSVAKTIFSELDYRKEFPIDEN